MKIYFKSNFYFDIAIGILALILFSLGANLYTPVKTLSQFFLMSVIPGHFLTLLFFPRKRNPDAKGSFDDEINRYPAGLERLIIAFFSGLAFSSASLFILNFYINLQLNSNQSLFLFNLIVMLFAAIRTLAIEIEDRYFWEISYEVPSSSDTNSRELAIIISLILILGYSISLFISVIPSFGEPEGFTEFYIIGPDGLASDYPNNAENGDTVSILIGIENHESSDVEYNLQISKSIYDNSSGNIHSDSLEFYEVKINESYTILRGQQLLIPFSMVLDSSGFWVLEFDLFMNSTDHSSSAYRHLQLNLDVE